jgi:replicative DNA helicase
MHLIRRTHKDPQQGEERLSFYSNTIANATNDANVNTLLLSQLSREGLFTRDGLPLEPEPRHLKGSSSMEQMATQIIFVFQDTHAGKGTIPDKTPTIIKVSKNRFGPTGIAEFVFLKSRQKLIPRGVWDECHEQYEQREEPIEEGPLPF